MSDLGALGLLYAFLAAMLEQFPPSPAHLVYTLNLYPVKPNPDDSIILFIYLFYFS